MRIPPRRLSAVALLVLIGSLVAIEPAPASERGANEPPTSTIRIRLKSATLRVRCRGGECAVSVQRDPAGGVAVSVTRTRDGVPFTFAKTVATPINVAIETGIGNDTVTVGDVSVAGFVRIGLGSGDDTLHVNGTSAGTKATIDAGAGNDSLSLAFGTVGGKFRLNAKGGDDDVTIASGHFADQAGLDGSQGSDGLLMQANPFTIAPTIKSFER